MKINLKTTRDQLDHYFGNNVGGLRFLRLEGLADDKKAHECQREFIDGIELVIRKLFEGEYLESEGIGETQLRRILEVARDSDWTQAETIRQLYRAESEITGKKYNEEFYAKTI